MTEEDVEIDVDVQLFFRGDDLDPEDVTRLLSIKPSIKHKRGDHHGEKNEMIWKTGFWLVETREYVESKDIDQHLKWILDQLEPVSDQVEFIMSQDKVYGEVNLLFSLYKPNWDSLLQTSLIGRMAGLKIPLGISISYLGFSYDKG
jgi:hypothetical protein